MEITDDVDWRWTVFLSFDRVCACACLSCDFRVSLCCFSLCFSVVRLAYFFSLYVLVVFLIQMATSSAGKNVRCMCLLQAGTKFSIVSIYKLQHFDRRVVDCCSLTKYFQFVIICLQAQDEHHFFSCIASCLISNVRLYFFLQVLRYTIDSCWCVRLAVHKPLIVHFASSICELYVYSRISCIINDVGCEHCN